MITSDDCSKPPPLRYLRIQDDRNWCPRVTRYNEVQRKESYSTGATWSYPYCWALGAHATRTYETIDSTKVVIVWSLLIECLRYE